MTTERVKEWLDGYIQQREKEYGSAFHKDEKSIEEFYNFLSSLSAERCIWKRLEDRGEYELFDACLTPTELAYSAIDEFEYCPYCGKRIEVKDE